MNCAFRGEVGLRPVEKSHYDWTMEAEEYKIMVEEECKIHSRVGGSR